MTSDESSVRPSVDWTPRDAGRPPDTRLAAMRAGFLALFEDEYHKVARFVMVNGAGREEALDATQAAFAEAWLLIQRRPEQWEAVRDPRAWIRTIALRTYRRPPDRRREPPTVLRSGPDETAWSGQDPGELTAQTLHVLQALRRLPPDVRTAMAFHIDGFRPVDIAVELGVTDQQARDLLKKGRRILTREADVIMARRGTDERRP
ncbi:RNA polymerase sigma factor [Sphaerisporangium siamense]|uniref:RNA polymerase sigma-70 factor (ECF subfamily) n=1 Tax=Sphaerisporangium siamense TaxID=795645 RepID=A0A7W7G8P7_9ACTN|nr:sigma factor-like helix-turn-helix DNA-binding protein [Sphaerisporangium siamense]MBB4699715.1 RNA polymerase sigma-70 factor (ECF subfamily) [Sphaerisporangium siamense]